MGLIEVLAVVASGFAVVGLADVVLRFFHACCQWVWRCLRASERVPALFRDLLNLSTIAINIHVLLEDYRRSPFALEDRKALLDFDALLRDCEHDLEELKKTTTTLTYAATDSWHLWLWKSVSYGFRSAGIEKRCFQLERQFSSVNSALSVTGCQNEIALRGAVGSTLQIVTKTQGYIGELVQETNDGFQGVTTVVTSNHAAVQKGVAALDHKIENFGFEIDTRTDQMFETMLNAGALAETQHSTVTTTLSNIKTVAEHGLDNIKAALQQQKKLLRKQQLSERRILASLENTRECVSSIESSADDEEASMSGVNLEALAYPLCLMRTEFERSLDSCVSDGTIDITVTESSWIHKEFENLLAASYMASARAINPSAHPSGSHHSKFGTSAGRKKDSQNPQMPSVDTTPAANYLHGTSNQSVTLRHNHRTIFHTPVGTLVIQSDKLKGHTSSKSTSFRFVFSPNPNMSSVGVSAKLTKTWNTLQGYTIQQHIRQFQVIRYNAKINTLLIADDVAGIQALISAGHVSPFDCSEKGWSILDYAAWRSAPQAYKFLLEQGAGSDTLYPRSTEVTSLSKFQPEASSETARCFQIYTSIAAQRLSSIWGRGGSLIHDLAYFDMRWDFQCLPFAEIIDALLEDGEEIDARDETGCTTLLNACYLGCSASYIKLLLQKGADVNALDTGGWNALHQIGYSVRHDYQAMRSSSIQTQRPKRSPSLHCPRDQRP